MDLFISLEGTVERFLNRFPSPRFVQGEGLWYLPYYQESVFPSFEAHLSKGDIRDMLAAGGGKIRWL